MRHDKSSSYTPPRHRPAILPLLALGVLPIGCDPAVFPSDPDLLADLESLRSSPDAVVKLYNTPIPALASTASHLWFVVKPAGSDTFDRWEVWVSPAGPYGYVRENLFGLTVGLGAGQTTLVAELIGSAAEPVVEFIQAQSPNYPCSRHYVFFPGPNSATYIQWVLDSTGWVAGLPPTAVGADTALLSLCP